MAALTPLYSYAIDPFPGNPVGTSISSGLTSGYEPSGAEWNAESGMLFLCGDNGRITRMNRDGGDVTTWALSGNWEGLAIAEPTSRWLYVVNENTGTVREFDIILGSGARSFSLTAAIADAGITPLDTSDLDALTDDGDGKGIESLTFVPVSGDPQGGAFYAGSQENGFIYRFSLPLRSGSTIAYRGKFKTWPSGNNDLSGLTYLPHSQLLLAVWDASNILRAMTTTGIIIKEWHVPAGSADEEGIAFDGTALFITEDPAPPSRVWRYDQVDLGLKIVDAVFTNGFE